MKTLTDALQDWLPAARERVEQLSLERGVRHVGRIDHVGDGVVNVSGLPNTRLDEILRFENGALGIALQVSVDGIGCVLLDDTRDLAAGGEVYGTGEIVRVPVGPQLLGRVVDPVGNPLDDGPHINPERLDPIDRPAPAIVDRELVTEPLMTGITVIDAMIPLGRGQRELVIGDRKTGKTAIALDTIINQRDTGVICVYVAVGQKRSSINDVINAVRTHGRIEHCVFVVGAADTAAGAQWIAPYAACTIAEYFRDQGRDALLVIDDLSKHAVIYRQLSLLLRKPPGREAYPGDIFYVHARLLERAAKLSEALGGGSLTALPIAETQAGDLSAYIPTNLISITDGQIYLEPKLFYEGQKPAINVGMSVSRVGGKTQAPIMRELAGRLRLEYAQFLELEVFTRFGAMVDERSRKAIEHGRRIRAILAQPQYAPLTLLHQTGLLLALDQRLLDAVPLSTVARFRAELGSHLAGSCPQVARHIEATGELGDEERQDLLRAIKLLLATLDPSPGGPDGTADPA
jgi:F-type H+-transporting ATPase subunit alpha